MLAVSHSRCLTHLPDCCAGGITWWVLIWSPNPILAPVFVHQICISRAYLVYACATHDPYQRYVTIWTKALALTRCHLVGDYGPGTGCVEPGEVVASHCYCSLTQQITNKVAKFIMWYTVGCNQKEIALHRLIIKMRASSQDSIYTVSRLCVIS